MVAAKLISQVISEWAGKRTGVGKTGKRQLQPTLAVALREAGFVADQDDPGQILRSGMPAWRSKDDGNIEPTIARRLVDIVLYQDQRLVGMIETESDLNDLRESGVTRRNGHFDVWSIARSATGSHFDSYKSLERMASAVFYWHLLQKTGVYPTAEEAMTMLSANKADHRDEHNPANIGLYLVSGFCRAQDKAILAPRLRSLGAELVCVFV